MSDQLLEPRHVTFSEMRTWVRQIPGLLLREIVSFLSLNAAVLWLFTRFDSTWDEPFVAIMGLAYFAMILLAHAADHSEPVSPWEVVKHLARRSKVTLLLICFFPLLPWLLLPILLPLVSLFNWLGLNASQAGGSAGLTYSSEWLYAASHLAQQVLYHYAFFSIWSALFVGPLVYFHDAPFRAAFRVSARAYQINTSTLGVVGVGAFLFAFIVRFLPWLGFVALPIVAVFHYLAYRAVFLGRTENLPVPAEERAPILVPAPVGSR